MTEKEFSNLEVGKKFNANGKRFLVVESSYAECKGCFFYKNNSFDCSEWASDLPYCCGAVREDNKYVKFKEIKADDVINNNKPHSDKILSFEEIVRSGLDIKVRVKDRDFRLVFIGEDTELTSSGFLILTKTDDEKAWDIIGTESEFKEAELCFVTEVSIYRDLSYDEVEDDTSSKF